MNKENNNNGRINKIISFIQIYERLYNNRIFKYKYIFFDTLLNEWFSISKTLITDKISELENITSIYIYNTYKNLFYTISNIINKYKIKVIYGLILIYNKKIVLSNLILSIIKYKEQKLKSRMIIFNNLIKRINEHIISIQNLYSIKELFIFYLFDNNIHYLKKENILKSKFIGNKIINNKKNMILSFIIWKNNSFKSQNLTKYYVEKIVFFQCNSLIRIYKRKFKYLFHLFINNISKSYNKYIINKNKSRINILYLSLLFSHLNKCITNMKSIFFDNINLGLYSRKNSIFSFNIIILIIKNISTKFKHTFLNNLKVYILNRAKKNKLASEIIFKIFYSNKKKFFYFFINSIKSQYFAKKNNIINPKKFFPDNNTDLLIKVINIYYKYHNFIRWKNEVNLKKYFNKWKYIIKLYQYQELIGYNNFIKNKFKQYNNHNIIMKNKLQQIKTKNKLNLKEKLKNKNEKIIISENTGKIIDTEELNLKNDNLKLICLSYLEKIKNKNGLIISNLQNQINNLIKEIEFLSLDL